MSNNRSKPITTITGDNKHTIIDKRDILKRLIQPWLPTSPCSGVTIIENDKITFYPAVNKLIF
jgi:hypothetical protein